MPIYAYKCASCGFAKDVLQKISDAPLSQCPSCGQSTFTKQVTAASFQLKGSGWYVTDFRNGDNSGKPAETPASSASAEGASAAASPASAPSPAAAPSPAPAPTSGGASGG